jgi:hypothetical protein
LNRFQWIKCGTFLDEAHGTGKGELRGELTLPTDESGGILASTQIAFLALRRGWSYALHGSVTSEHPARTTGTAIAMAAMVRGFMAAPICGEYA